ncbi:sigma-70 family RNA polymerase sigma factor [Saccharothrix texasensis]|uniref:RNA polymerase sigma factor (Sigma-70 family) n=1 Tax=Saccharothrix texasensis TaxID=103734 RepID=A0A3N1HHP5_9PSEU|nr:sigma-70 family RNA polymerase sigma factor [Saccharothrix texasensis]ROP42039.1 RNA polymerase sigma factor (sigma-70 family) [Saccharothrix texasensis]
MRTTVDAEVVAAARSGDRRALDDLVAACLPLVHNVVRRALPGDPEADDVVQETMLRVVRGLPALNDPERFRAWVVTTAIRQVRNHARGRRAALARRLPLAAVAEAPDPRARVAEDAVERVAAAHERQDLLAATRWLAPDEQRVLALWWQEVNGELTRADVAEALALSPAHTAVRVQRMKERLLTARTVLHAWRATPRCPGLAATGRGWSGAPERRWLTRLARHVRDCPVCTVAGRPRTSSEHLALGIGLLAVPSAWSGLPAQAAAGLVEGVRRLFDALSAKPALLAVPVLGGAAVALTVWITPLPVEDGIALPTTSTAAAAQTPVAPTSAAAPVALYVSPDGDDAAPGTEAAPFASLGHAVSVVRPGQTIYLRGGTHRPTAPVEITTSGHPGHPITLTAPPGEHAVLDASRVTGDGPFIVQRAEHWAVRGLEITGAPGAAYSCESCRATVFQHLSVHGNLGTGLRLQGPGTTDNQVLDSDFHDNHDPAGQEADGLALGPGSGTGNVVRGCRTFDNVDDGLVVDGFTDPVTVDSTWSWGNGINRWSLPAADGSGHGFDLGDVGAHVVTGSAAWKNNGHGFAAGGGTPKQFTRNSALRNAGDGFALGASGSQVRRNYSFGNREQVVPTRRVPAEGNTWDGPGWGTHVLRELDPATAEGPRAPDGSLPPTEYLTNTKDASVGAPMTAPR